jgi:N-acetylglucosamine kinase-like BadF-type ATPase
MIRPEIEDMASMVLNFAAVMHDGSRPFRAVIDDAMTEVGLDPHQNIEVAEKAEEIAARLRSKGLTR